MHELRQKHPLEALLQVAGLARSTYHYQQRLRDRPDRDSELKSRVRAVFDAHAARYGYRRVTAALRNEGLQVNHKAVQRVMGEMGLRCCVRPKKYRAWRGEVGRAAPDLLQRCFNADEPNRKWVTDVTEFNVKGRKLYLSPVLDLYNGEIVAYETAERPAFELVGNMLKKALSGLGRDERPLLHSDQGWHYRIPAWRHLLASRALTQSMSRKGNCLDNAAMESFFATLKSEFFYPQHFEDIEQLRAGIDRYVHYYNHERIKLKLKGLSPVQYRTQPRIAA